MTTILKYSPSAKTLLDTTRLQDSRYWLNAPDARGIRESADETMFQSIRLF